MRSYEIVETKTQIRRRGLMNGYANDEGLAPGIASADPALPFY